MIKLSGNSFLIATFDHGFVVHKYKRADNGSLKLTFDWIKPHG
jgi:hypothetical protein